MAIKRPPPIEAPLLRPAAEPVNTFVRPEAPLLAPDAPQPTALLRLADSLRSLSPRLAEFSDAYLRANVEQGESEAIGLRLKTQTDELSARIAKGDIPPEVNRAALDLGHGEDVARRDFEDIRQRYLGQSTTGNPLDNNAFDRDSGDLDAWFKSVVLEKEKALPQTPGVLHGWRNRVEEYRQQLYTEHDGYYAQRTKEANQDAAYKDLYGTAVGAVNLGERDPVKIHGAMREAFAKTSKIHLLSPAETDEAMAVAGKSIADQGIPGNPQLGVDLVKEIFLGQRDGVPPLGTSAKYADLANKTIEQAQKTAGELQRKLNVTLAVDFREAASTGTLKEPEFIKFTEANPYVFSQAEREEILTRNRLALTEARAKQSKIAETLALKAEAQASENDINVMLRKAGDDGTLLTIPEKTSYKKEDGSAGSYSRQELLDRAVENRLAEIDAWAQSIKKQPGTEGLDVEALKLDREISYFARNNVPNPSWRDLLNSAYAAATPDALAANAQNVPPHLLQAVQLYEQLEAKAPGVLRRHLADEGAKDFYQTYRVARTLLRQDERQALHTAALATKGLVDETQFAPAYDKVETELSKAGSIWPWAQGINNYGEMLGDVRRLGRVLVRAGLSPTLALERAGEAVRGQYANINGYMVRTSDRNVESFGANLAALKLQPRVFEDVARDYLKRYASDQHDPGSLSIRPMTNGVGTWAVIDATTGFPVESNSGLSPQISIQGLVDFEKANQEGKIEEKLKELRYPRSMAPHNLLRRAFGFEDLPEDDLPEPMRLGGPTPDNNSGESKGEELVRRVKEQEAQRPTTPGEDLVKRTREREAKPK